MVGPRFSRTRRPLFTIVGIAAVTAALGLGVTLPRATHAVGEDRGGWTEKGFRLGAVLATIELAADPKALHGWQLRIVAENTSDAPTTCTLDAAITYASWIGASRMGPDKKAIWRRPEKIRLAAREKRVVAIDVPDAIAREMSSAARVATKRQELLDFWNKRNEMPSWVAALVYRPESIYGADIVPGWT